MRLPGLLSVVLAASLLCAAADQSTAPDTNRIVTRSGNNGFMFTAMPDGQKPPEVPLSVRQRAKPLNSDANGCLMLRTYIMVRESRDSDVTYRDGYVVCQPAWKFQVRTAVGTVEDR